MREAKKEEEGKKEGRKDKSWLLPLKNYQTDREGRQMQQSLYCNVIKVHTGKGKQDDHKRGHFHEQGGSWSDQESFYKLASCKLGALFQKMNLLSLWGQKYKVESQGDFSPQTITEKPVTWIHSLHQLGALLVSTR